MNRGNLSSRERGERGLLFGRFVRSLKVLLPVTAGVIIGMALLLSQEKVTLAQATTPVPTAKPLAPVPQYYSGMAMIQDGSSVPDGYMIEGRIGDYWSEPVTVRNGRYRNLKVAPVVAPASDDIRVTFHLGDVQAIEDDKFVDRMAPGDNSFKDYFHLTFLKLPQPTPTPTGIPSPTPTVVPTSTPTPTPIVALPIAYNGILIVGSADPPESASLVARIGEYESTKAKVVGDVYRGLIINPGDSALIGSRIEFLLNGFRALTVDVYRNDAPTKRLDLLFEKFPTPTAVPQAVVTPLPPTPTPTPIPTPTPSPTPVPTPDIEATVVARVEAKQEQEAAVRAKVEAMAKATVEAIVQSASTPIPSPTATGTSTPTPTATSTPTPTATVTMTPSPVVALSLFDTSTPPMGTTTDTAGSFGGACFFSRAASSGATAGLLNVALLLAPVGMMAGYRRTKRRGSS